MPNSRMQQLDEHRYQAWRASRRVSVSNAGPVIVAGAVLAGLGAAGVAVGLVQGMFVIGAGVLLACRGLAIRSRLRRLAAIPPLAEREPWLFARAPFGADGSVPGAGWQPDPLGQGSLRFWDGGTWTADIRPGGQ